MSVKTVLLKHSIHEIETFVHDKIEIPKESLIISLVDLGEKDISMLIRKSILISSQKNVFYYIKENLEIISRCDKVFNCDC